MERYAIINHNSFRAIGLHKSRSPLSPYGPAPQGSQLITLLFCGLVLVLVLMLMPQEEKCTTVESQSCRPISEEICQTGQSQSHSAEEEYLV